MLGVSRHIPDAIHRNVNHYRIAHVTNVLIRTIVVLLSPGSVREYLDGSLLESNIFASRRECKHADDTLTRIVRCRLVKH